MEYSVTIFPFFWEKSPIFFKLFEKISPHLDSGFSLVTFFKPVFLKYLLPRRNSNDLELKRKFKFSSLLFVHFAQPLLVIFNCWPQFQGNTRFYS